MMDDPRTAVARQLAKAHEHFAELQQTLRSSLVTGPLADISRVLATSSSAPFRVFMEKLPK